MQSINQKGLCVKCENMDFLGITDDYTYHLIVYNWYYLPTICYFIKLFFGVYNA